MKDARVLVTGATGFVGRRLIQRLLDLGLEVYALVRPRADKSYNLPPLVKTVEADITDFASVKRALRATEPDVIFHLAAQSFVPYSFEDPAYTFDVNITGSVNILEAVRQLEIDPVLHFAGSSEEYGIQYVSEKHYERVRELLPYAQPPVRMPEIPIDETNPLRPASPYAVSKVAVDMMWSMYRTWYGLKTLVTRAFNHEGRGRGPMFVTSQIVSQLRKSTTLVLGNIASFRDWSHVEDTVSAYIFLALNKHTGVYVVGSARTNSVLTFATLVSSKIYGRVDKVCVDSVCEEFEESTCEIGNIKFPCYSTDAILFSYVEQLEAPKFAEIYTERNKITVVVDRNRLRPLDVPILMSNPAKLMALGWAPKRSLADIIDEMLS